MTVCHCWRHRSSCVIELRFLGISNIVVPVITLNRKQSTVNGKLSLRKTLNILLRPILRPLRHLFHAQGRTRPSPPNRRNLIPDPVPEKKKEKPNAVQRGDPHVADEVGHLPERGEGKSFLGISAPARPAPINSSRSDLHRGSPFGE